MVDIFAEIADERRQLARQLAGLSAEQQQTPSLCAAWNVHEVVAHLVMPMEVPIYRFAFAMLASKGNFDQANQKLAQKLARRRFADLLETLNAKADHRFTPPGEGPLAPLTDIVVHGLDVRWPLHLPCETPSHRLQAVLDFLVTAPKSFVPAGLPDGLSFQATDLAWCHGEGAQVSGSAAAIALTLTGRPAGLEHLEGAGVAQLRAALG